MRWGRSAAALTTFVIANGSCHQRTAAGPASAPGAGSLHAQTDGATATTASGTLRVIAGDAILSASTVPANSSIADPAGVAVDGAGTLYVADRLDDVILRVDAAGAATIIAGRTRAQGNADGNGLDARFDRPWGLAWSAGTGSPTAGTLYVADSENQVIRAIDCASGAVTTLAGAPGQSGSTDGPAGAARFMRPATLALDDAGGLWVGEVGVPRVRRIAAGGASVTTIAVDGATLAPGRPLALAADGHGHALATDGSHVFTIAAPTDSASGTVTTLAITGTPALLPGGFVASGTSSAWLGDLTTYAVYNIDLTSGAATALVPKAKRATWPPLEFPQALALDPKGGLYVGDGWQNGQIASISTSGVVTPLAGWRPTAKSRVSDAALTPASPLPHPWGVAISSDDKKAYVACPSGPYLAEVDLATGTVIPLPAPTDGTLSTPTALTSDVVNRILYFTDGAGDTVRSFSLVSRSYAIVAGRAAEAGSADGTSAARFDFPVGITFDDSTGGLYVADANNHAVRHVDLQTHRVTTVAQGGSGDTALVNPWGVSNDGGLLYVADRGARRVFSIDDQSNDQGTGQASVSVVASLTASPSDVRARGGTLFVTVPDDGTVLEIDGSGNVSTLGGVAGQRGLRGGNLPAGLNEPAFLAFDGQGDLLVTDTAESSLAVIHSER
jgi:DNA-binding beta-propeller fold protein YncE